MAVTTNVMRSLTPIFTWLTVPSPISASPTIRMPEMSAVRTPWSIPYATWGLRMLASAEPSTIAQPMRWRTMRITLTILIRFTLSATPGNFLTRRHNFGAAVGTITRFGAAPAAASAKTLPMPGPRYQRLGADWGSKALRDAEPPKPRTASLSVRYRAALAIVHTFY